MCLSTQTSRKLDKIFFPNPEMWCCLLTDGLLVVSQRLPNEISPREDCLKTLLKMGAQDFVPSCRAGLSGIFLFRA